MARTNGGPPCPKPERLEELIDFITELKEEGEEPLQDYNLRLQETVEALDWLHTHLSNRNLYHKKQSHKQKIRLQLLREQLGEDFSALDEQAEQLAQRKLSDEVANS